MNWQSLGGALIKAGAPVIGNALGGPLGGMIGEAVGGVLAGTLGVPATPEAVDEALRTAPAGELQAKLSAAEAEAAAKWPALAEIATAEAEAAARSLAESAATMRAEAVSGDPVQRWWRPLYAFELTLECAAFWFALVRDLFVGGDLKVINAAIGATAILSVYWSARFAVLGVYVSGRSREKEAAVTGRLPPSVIEQIVKAVRRR